MLKLFSTQKARDETFDPQTIIHRLVDLNPSSALAYQKRVVLGSQTEESLGRVFFLQRNKKPYCEGSSIYVTAPEGLKLDKESRLLGTGETVVLQFLHRRVPHKFDCRVIGRFRLLPEVAETLDFRVQSAFKLQPSGTIRKEDKRNYLRYSVRNYGDTRVPLTTHVSFEAFLKPTNRETTAEGAPPMELRDLRIMPVRAQAYPQHFDSREVVEQFRRVLLELPPSERQVHLTKVVHQEAQGYRRPKQAVHLLGYANVLGLEKELLRHVIYTKKSAKSDASKDNPCNLHPGDRVLTHFSAGGSYYEMVCEVMEARTQNEVFRPVSFIHEETGLKVDLVEYSVGGALIESSPELLRLLLGKRCPEDLGPNATYVGRYWEQTFEALKHPLLHLSFYPKLHFPDKLKQFEPELPYRINLVAQVMRSHVHSWADKKTLQHGLRFAYDPLNVVLPQGDEVTWKLIRGVRDNTHFTDIHSRLSQLYGYLENQTMLQNTPRR
jgi:hypothetical protein